MPRRIAIGAVTLVASLLVPVAAPAPASAAPPALTPVRQMGGPGHAGLYGWGAATAPDGSVYIGDYWNYRIRHYAKDGTFLGDVVTRQASAHLAPYGIGVDPTNGDIYFGDVDLKATVDKYSANGTRLLEFGGIGSGAGKFIYPARVAVANDRTVYVGDARDNAISAHTPTGSELFSKKGGAVMRPRGMDFDNGTPQRLYVADALLKRVQVFDTNLNLVASFGDTYFGSDLRGLAVDRVNNWVYVVDSSKAKVFKFTTSGQFLTSWGGFGNGDGLFSDGGREVTVDGDSNVWVGDMPSFRAQKFSPTGQFLFSVPNPPEPPVPGGFAEPRGIATDAGGNIFVADTHNFRAEKLDPNGNFLLQWGRRGGDEKYTLNYPRAVAADPRDGSVVVANTDATNIKKYDANGVYQWTASVPNHSQGVAIGPDGKVYACNYNAGTVLVFSDSGQLLSQFGSLGSGNGQFSKTQSAAVDADGTIWVIDDLRGTVQHFSATGAFLGRFGSLGSADNQLASAWDVAVDAAYVYVSDKGNDKIKIWDKAGVFQGAYGGSGSTPGKFQGLRGVDIGANGHLYTIEQQGERIQEFSIGPPLPPDPVPPNGTVTVPTKNQAFPLGTVAMSGAATDDVGVAAVDVAIQNRTTLQWWTGTGWGTFKWLGATVASPGATSTTWAYNWPAPATGTYALQVRAVDGAGNVDPTKPWVTFRVT